jgi:hypothetical protein
MLVSMPSPALQKAPDQVAVTASLFGKAFHGVDMGIGWALCKAKITLAGPFQT